MNCDDTEALLLNGSFDDPSLVRHVRTCTHCADQLRLLQAVLPAFHEQLDPVPNTPSKPRYTMPNLSSLLLLAATVSVITLAGTQAFLPEPAVQTAAAPKADATQARSIRAIPWDALTPEDWHAKAVALLPDATAALKHGGATEDHLLILTQTGRAAENSNRPEAPFFAEREKTQVNRYYWEAAQLVKQEPGLLLTLHNSDVLSAVNELAGVTTPPLSPPSAAITAARRVEAIPADALTQADWKSELDRMLPHAEQALALGTPTPTHFLVLIHTGRVTTLSKVTGAPHYRVQQGQTINTYYQAAAQMLKKNPGLQQLVYDADIQAKLDNLK